MQFTKNMIHIVSNEYNSVLNGRSYTNRGKSAFDSADSVALSLVYKHFGVTLPSKAARDIRKQIRYDATALRIKAIGY